jgi:hypothetical protein
MDDQTIVGAVSGEFVTETFEYDGGRQVTVYVPPDPPEAIVFAGDGQFISQWGEAEYVEPTPAPGPGFILAWCAGLLARLATRSDRP